MGRRRLGKSPFRAFIFEGVMREVARTDDGGESVISNELPIKPAEPETDALPSDELAAFPASLAIDDEGFVFFPETIV